MGPEGDAGTARLKSDATRCHALDCLFEIEKKRDRPAERGVSSRQRAKPIAMRRTWHCGLLFGGAKGQEVLRAFNGILEAAEELL